MRIFPSLRQFTNSHRCVAAGFIFLATTGAPAWMIAVMVFLPRPKISPHSSTLTQRNVTTAATGSGGVSLRVMRFFLEEVGPAIFFVALTATLL